MPPKWLVSYPFNATDVPERSKDESDRDYARTLVHSQHFERASHIYSSLLIKENDPLLFTNRSLCFYKLEDFVSSARLIVCGALIF